VGPVLAVEGPLLEPKALKASKVVKAPRAFKVLKESKAPLARVLRVHKVLRALEQALKILTTQFQRLL
jgi:hypothetical protein